MTKMHLLPFSNNSAVTLRLDLSDFEDSLPFPLSESWYIQSIIWILMLATFVLGLKFRYLIIRYLMSPECKGPINALIWADQVNGIFMAVEIIIKMVIMVCSFPLAKVLGESFCDWTCLLIAFYLAGTAAYSCSIAVFRVVVIKGTNLIGEGKLLKILLTVSLLLHISFGIGTAMSDNKNATRKMCLHYSDAEAEYLDLYKEFSEPFSLLSFGRKDIVLLFSCCGMVVTVLELSCYIVFFHHLRHHNNTIASTVVSQNVIKQRNRTNAISMLGLFLTWILEVCFIAFVGIVVTIFDQEWIREYPSTLKMIEFALVPWIQTLTSSPIRQFRQKLNGQVQHME